MISLRAMSTRKPLNLNRCGNFTSNFIKLGHFHETSQAQFAQELLDPPLYFRYRNVVVAADLRTILTGESSSYFVALVAVGGQCFPSTSVQFCKGA